MGNSYGIASHGTHSDTPHRPPGRYLVIIDSAGSTIARLFIESRELVGEFDASTEEVATMIQGLAPARDAHAPEWDRALAGHSLAERAAADVYTLDV